MWVNKWLRQLIVLVIFLFLIIALENRQVVQTISDFGNEQRLTVLIPQPCTTLDPAKVTDRQSAMIINNIYEGLVKYQPQSTDIEPALATKWEVKEKGKEWIFSLRRDVKFHDDTPFNAQAVKASVERVMVNKQTMPYAEMAFGMVDKIEILDDYTVKFILKYPYAPFLHNLAMPWAAPMVSPTAVANFGADFGTHPVGTGPYRLEKWQPDGTLILAANEKYWQRSPQTKQVHIKVEANAEQRYQQLATGKADIITNAPLDQVAKAEQQRLTVVQQPNLSINYLGFYNNKPPFDSSRIRRAVLMSLDRPQLIKDLYNNRFASAESYIPPNMLGHSDKLTQYPYNPTAAKELLQQNGYPDGMTITLITYQQPMPYNSVGGEALALAIKKQLVDMGITVNIKAYPWSEYKAALKQQQGHCFLYGWTSDNGDPDNILYPLLTSPQIDRGLNVTRYSNPQVDRMLASAQQVTDRKSRQTIYYHTQQIILQEAPWVVLNYGCDFTITTPKVRDITYNAVGGLCFDTMHKD
ncbi:ABC transporter substrate-binding protein [Peptococcaceae bacterium 1198_IL3148]